MIKNAGDHLDDEHLLPTPYPKQMWTQDLNAGLPTIVETLEINVMNVYGLFPYIYDSLKI